MPFFYTKNLTETALHTGQDPWDFVLSETLTAQIRGDKQSRQDWYRNTATQHYFYTLVEPINPNMRPSKENPPYKLHGLAVDYDAKLTTSRITEALASFPRKPNWIERSLGGNVRLVWLFSEPLRVENHEFCKVILQEAVKWLELGHLPSLDENAFTDPHRLLCNGCQWTPTGEPAIPMASLQAFYVECARKLKWEPAGDVQIPLDIVEKALRERYTNMNWPGEFAIESQGPSFWIDGSVSAMSAIVKPAGMFTFAAHAEKPFYNWADLLGAEFVKDFADDSITKATKDIWFDGRSFYMKNDRGVYVAQTERNLLLHFRNACRLTAKAGKDGLSQIDKALYHIVHGPGRIDGAAPFVFHPPGIIIYQCKKKLNVYDGHVLQAATQDSFWGPGGGFEWLSEYYEYYFCSKDQIPYHIAWQKHFYVSGMLNKPLPGQNNMYLGAPGVGKTLSTQIINGTLVGGFADASDYVLKGGGFNSHLLEAPLWTIDDETRGETQAQQNNIAAILKKMSANQEHLYSKKFEVPCMVSWQGRANSTSNLDYISSRTLAGLDNSSLDKTNLFLCRKEVDKSFVFPDRHRVMEVITRELPRYARFLIDYEVPEHVTRDPRYGFLAYHHPELLDRAHQASRAAPFKELLFEAIREYFRANPEATEWRGTETVLTRLLHGNPQNECIIRTLRIEQIGRYLEMIQKEGILRCEVNTGDLKTKVWTFPRSSFDKTPPETAVVHNVVTDQKSRFEK